MNVVAAIEGSEPNRANRGPVTERTNLVRNGRAAMTEALVILTNEVEAETHKANRRLKVLVPRRETMTTAIMMLGIAYRMSLALMIYKIAEISGRSEGCHQRYGMGLFEFQATGDGIGDIMVFVSNFFDALPRLLGNPDIAVIQNQGYKRYADSCFMDTYRGQKQNQFLGRRAKRIS